MGFGFSSQLCVHPVKQQIKLVCSLDSHIASLRKENSKHQKSSSAGSSCSALNLCNQLTHPSETAPEKISGPTATKQRAEQLPLTSRFKEQSSRQFVWRWKWKSIERICAVISQVPLTPWGQWERMCVLYPSAMAHLFWRES